MYQALNAQQILVLGEIYPLIGGENVYGGWQSPEYF